MKMNRAMLMAAFLAAPLMTKAAPAVEPISSEEKGFVAVWADTVEQYGRDHTRAEECEGLTLDETQKTALKDAKYAFYKDMNIAKANLKNAMLDYTHTLASMTSTRDQGQASADALKASFNALGDIKMNFELKVFYDILKPEQREPAMKCFMKKMTDDAKKKLQRACDRMKKPKNP
ncbi:hypothetical protein [Bdellovibrio sp. HCB2-146]|uniref:hypothetical protein n=1 Tax=Bdellovibrio sp. HCB2-146 TaxID=3394362 RepID=UPI0039BC341B